MQGEWMLDNISIVYCMSLQNTPIIWAASMTNCKILSREICFKRKSVLQIQFIGEWMKVHYISNFTDGLRKTIWHIVKSLEVVLTVGQAWQMAGPHISILTLCHQSLIGEY